jgi:succinyl-diaminopimelate desuccinylase
MTPTLPLLLAALVASETAPLHRRFDQVESKQLVPLLTEVVRFRTTEGAVEAHAAQKKWLTDVGTRLGFTVRDQGAVTEIELPGPAGAPVLGLVVHGDVQPVDEEAWTFPPFGGLVRDGYVLGRGSADDKGPLVQALLAMKVLKESRRKRTQTIRLLVGTDEESGSTDMTQYLAAHPAPALSLVLDSAFPVVVGEKAWNALTITTGVARPEASSLPYEVASIDAGLATAIVPDHARLVLRWKGGAPQWDALTERLRAKTLRDGTRLATAPQDAALTIAVYGHSAHAGVNLEGGRNALVSLAEVMDGELPPSGARDLLAFARTAGRDIYGSGLGLTTDDPLWGRYAVNVATIKPTEDGRLRLTINIRRTPPATAALFEAQMKSLVADFAQQRGAPMEAGGFFADEPLVFDPHAKIVRRLLAAYQRATGAPARPSISGGGTYAKRLPNAIAFGMWFPDKPYPGHDVDERAPIEDLRKGTHILLEALADLAYTLPIAEPFKP